MKVNMHDIIEEFEREWQELGGCTDGHCVLNPPKGMHTNGGCRCTSDKIKMQKAMYVIKRLRLRIEEAS